MRQQLYSKPDPAKKSAVTLKRLREENVARYLDEVDERRFRSAEISNGFGSSAPPSFFPGYEAEEVDDGRLDRTCRTGFVSVDQIPAETSTDEDAEIVVYGNRAKPTGTVELKRGLVIIRRGGRW